MPWFIANPPCGEFTLLSFRQQRYASLLGLGCFTWSTTCPCCGQPQNAPVLLFSRIDRYSREAARRIRPCLRITCPRREPRTRYPFSCTPALGRTSYARTTLAVVPSLPAIGCRRAIPDFTYPPFCPPAATYTGGGLPPTLADDFLGRGRLLPLTGFDTTTAPCLRAAMGDALRACG